MKCNDSLIELAFPAGESERGREERAQVVVVRVRGTERKREREKSERGSEEERRSDASRMHLECTEADACRRKTIRTREETCWTHNRGRTAGGPLEVCA